MRTTEFAQRDDAEVSVTNLAIRRLTNLAPEDRALGAAILVLFGLDREQRADFLRRQTRQADERDRLATQRIGELLEGTEVLEEQMIADYRQLPREVRQFVAVYVRGLRDEDMASASTAGMTAWEWVDRQRRERRVETASGDHHA